jgi:hypothetical protein
MNDQKLRISKIEAARRQLDSAIELWFLDKDEVSIHTLAAAAYQLVHDLKEHKGLARELLYDSAMIKDKYRKQWSKVIKKPMNFFKHADNDPEETLEFSPLGSMGFIMAAASGLRILGEPTSHTVYAFTLWLVVNKPSWITPKFRELYEERVGIDTLQGFKTVPKCNFLELFPRTSDATREIIF